MYSILKKEFNAFFASPIGFLVIGVFLLFTGLLLWFFQGNWNILNTGFADMQNFFELTPWLFMLLIPAISMRMFSDEFTTGTIEILKTRPLTNWQIVMGKFLAALSLILLSLLPTLVYAFSISSLASPETIDWGSIIGSYIGLIFLAASFTALSLFAAILSKNQIIALLIGIVFSFVFFYGFEQLAQWDPNLPNFIQKMGIYEHYKSIGKGVLDTRDFIYFISVSFFFLFVTTLKLDK